MKRVHKGRGALTNPSGRFEAEQREAFDDGWGSLDEPVQKPATQVTNERSRSLITYNDSPDLPFDRSINPYKGCEHGCIYCYARPSHAYLGMSPGLDFETRIVAKPDGAAVLRKQLSKRGYEPAVIALGANTDPYQPVERELGYTRAILEVLLEFRHPVAVITKSNLVLRDIDLWSALAERNLGHVMVSITSLDRALARRLEPRAATPSRRLDAVRRLSDAGVPVGVLAAPLIPALNDHELEVIFEAAAAAGARSARYILVRLPHEIKQLFADWLEEHYPDRAKRVLELIRTTRGGKLYDASYGTRMRGTGRYADLLAQRFELAARRFKLRESLPDADGSQFRVPSSRGAQLGLFDDR